MIKKNAIQEALILSELSLEKQKSGLLKHIKIGAKKAGGYELLIDEKADIKELEATEKKLKEIQKDMDCYQTLLLPEGSMEAIITEQSRC
jgi:hypothetical protein